MKLNARDFLRNCFEEAIQAVDPEHSLKNILPDKPKGRTFVVALGKAAVPMAAAFEKLWPYPCEGFALTRYGHSKAHTLKHIQSLEAAHPVPDEAGFVATKKIMKAGEALGSEDLLVALISGGGSSLLVAPPDGISLEDEQEMHRQLLVSGLGIQDMNLIRKHISRVKAGRLAQMASPAKVVSYVLSDIPGDDIRLVASGPTLPDPRSRTEALAVIAKQGFNFPSSIQKFLENAAADAPHPAEAIFQDQKAYLVGSSRMALEAASQFSKSKGVESLILSDQIEDESSIAAKNHVAEIQRLLSDSRLKFPLLLLSGGETRVTLRGQGKGGRNSEFLLALGLEFEKLKADFKFFALAADTDGIDGSEDNAGAFLDSMSLERMRRKGLKPAKCLEANDAYSAFEASGDLLMTGPTGTNVNDFRAILILKN